MWPVAPPQCLSAFYVSKRLKNDPGQAFLGTYTQRQMVRILV